MTQKEIEEIVYSHLVSQDEMDKKYDINKLTANYENPRMTYTVDDADFITRTMIEVSKRANKPLHEIDSEKIFAITKGIFTVVNDELSDIDNGYFETLQYIPHVIDTFLTTDSTNNKNKEK